MSKKDSDLVKKIRWAYNLKEVQPSDMSAVAHCQKLEDEGFGMLADKNNPKKIDASDSVVFPDGSVFTAAQIELYWEKRYKQSFAIYNSENPEDVKMNKADMYYKGFKLNLL